MTRSLKFTIVQLGTLALLMFALAVRDVLPFALQVALPVLLISAAGYCWGRAHEAHRWELEDAE